LFRVRAPGKEFLLSEGTDPRCGARHLKRAVERHLVSPLANLLATGQVRSGDMLCIDWDRRAGHLVFGKEGRVSELTISALGKPATKPAELRANGSKPSE